MSDLPTHVEWETTLRGAAASAKSSSDADYYNYYADQHGTAATRESRGGTCASDR